MPNQKLLADYCIPNLLANVQPIHHAWPNKIQTMDCLLSKKKRYWVNLRISMTTTSQIILKNGHVWTKTTATCLSSIKWLARKFSFIKWIDHVISGSTALCINWTGPCPSSVICKKVQLYKVTWVMYLMTLQNALPQFSFDKSALDAAQSLLLEGQVSLKKVLCHVYSPKRKILARNHWGDMFL